ncbi:KAP family P-loop NTPase fold protein [Nocardioides salarius]|uniref:KAP family P-loop NTPase fold protein n=1 Tax=Nocardioides salarius TaxID=374513 RepID=UPI0030F9B6D7
MAPDVPWWSDDPISSLSEDDLQRGPFAKQVAVVLDEVGAASATSTVIAVTGPWGSGKTSILKLALQHLKLAAWRIAWLNPWALSGPDAVTHELIASIASVMPDDKASRRIKETLIRYNDYATPLFALAPGGKVLEAWQKTANARRETNSLDRISRDLSRRLQESPHRILIVIDDIDRLQPDELLALFKSVRVLGRLPNVHYLLAFDQDTLLHVLAQTSLAHGDESRALAFLEKLVTVRLDQPPIRTEQADEMLDTAIRAVLTRASINPTEDQTRRLVLEREELLVPLLTEPRKITRYIAQLHGYLPLVGAEQLDFVDFFVLTYLRLAHPRLYQALADDQTTLTGDLDGSPRVELWTGGQRVAEFVGDTARDPERTRERLQTAIARLFPRASTEDATVTYLDRDQRRRDRRASDPDHVSRYFALNSDAEPISDATLAAALREWSTHITGPDSDTVFVALAPSADGTSASTAASRTGESISRLMRRLTARTVDLTDDQCGQAAAFVLSRADVFAANHTVRESAPTLIATLIDRQPSTDAHTTVNADLADHISKILARTTATGNTSATSTPSGYDTTRWPFTALVAAIRATGWTHAPNSSTSPTFLERLADHLTKTAWEIVQQDLTAQDDAPLNGATVALRLLDESWGQATVDRRVLSILDTSRNGIDHLAARYVDVGTVPATGQQTLVGFEVEAFGARYGRSRIDADRQRLVSEQGPPEADEDDLSWRNRRAIASRHLIRWLSSPHHRTKAIAPVARVDDRVISDLTADGFVSTSGANLPDLQVAVRFHLGGAPGPETSRDSQLTDQHEAEILAIAPDSRVADWLDSVREAWNIDYVSRWATNDGHPRLWTQVECHAQGPANGGRSAVPIVIKMKSEVGAADQQTPSMQLAVSVSFRMSALESSRQPAQRTYDDPPLPAALTVTELHQVLVALLGCRETARHLWADQHPDLDIPDASQTQIAMWSRGGMSRSIDLRQFSSNHVTQHSTYEATFLTTRENLSPQAWGQDPYDPDVAAAAIKEWAELEGHRRLDEYLADIQVSRRSH